MHHSLLCFIIGSATLIPPERWKTLSRSNKRGRKRKARDKKLISLSYRCCCSSLHPVVLLYCWISFKFMVPFKKMAMNYWLPIGASSMGEIKQHKRAQRKNEKLRDVPRKRKSPKQQLNEVWFLRWKLSESWCCRGGAKARWLSWSELLSVSQDLAMFRALRKLKNFKIQHNV